MQKNQKIEISVAEPRAELQESQTMEIQVDLETKLCKLIMEGDCEGVKKLSKNNIEIMRAVYPQGNSALHIAAAGRHPEMVELLLTLMPCTLSMRNSNNETPLHTAARSGNSEVVQVLLNVSNGLLCNCGSPSCPQKMDSEEVQEIWRAQNNKGETALHYAVEGNSVDVIEKLLNKVERIALIKNTNGESALSKACCYGCLEIAKRLLVVEPQVEDIRSDGTSCLHEAIIKILEWWDEGKDDNSRQGQGDEVEGTRIGLPGDEVENTRIELPGDEGEGTRIDDISYLQEANINILDDSCLFPRMIKNRRQGHDSPLELAFELVRKRPQLADAVDPSGNSPLHVLVALPSPNESHLKLAEELVKAAPNVNFRLNKDEMAPIHIAARDGNVEVIKLLIESAPHCSYLLGKDKKNALHFALEHGRCSSLSHKVHCLLQVSVDKEFLLHEPDNEGKTALSMLNEALLGRPKGFKEDGTEFSCAAKGDQSKEDVKGKSLFEGISIIAALIATITFAAAFTLPGGFDQVNGNPVLWHKVPLQVFILLDSLGFCLSVLALVQTLLIPFKDAFQEMDDNIPSGTIYSFFYGTRSLYRLMHPKTWAINSLIVSLYATTLAFASGVGVMFYPKYAWLSLTVWVICGISFLLELMPLMRLNLYFRGKRQGLW